MKVIRGRAAGAPSQKRTETFTGDVFADPVLPETDGVTVNNVFFTPGGRTHWHTHTDGQLLVVLAGEGRVRLDGEEEQVIAAGDVVWIAPGERHWHGAGPETAMLHMAVSLGGHEWMEPVA